MLISARINFFAEALDLVSQLTVDVKAAGNFERASEYKDFLRDGIETNLRSANVIESDVSIFDRTYWIVRIVIARHF